MKTLSFTKEKGTWYFDFKLWPGPKTALSMVQGANKLLNKLSDDGKHAKVKVSQKPLANAIKATLILPNKLSNGGDYIVEGPKGYPKKMWLCNVTRVVYLGQMPKELYILKVN